MGSRAANGLVISESYSNLNVPLKSLMLVKVALKRDPINGVIPHLAWYCPIYKMKQRAKTIRSFICALSLPFQLDRCWIHLLWLCRSSCFCRFLRYFVHKNVRSLTRWLHNSLHQSRPISLQIQLFHDLFCWCMSVVRFKHFLWALFCGAATKRSEIFIVRRFPTEASIIDFGDFDNNAIIPAPFEFKVSDDDILLHRRLFSFSASSIIMKLFTSMSWHSYLFPSPSLHSTGVERSAAFVRFVL